MSNSAINMVVNGAPYTLAHLLRMMTSEQELGYLRIRAAFDSTAHSIDLIETELETKERTIEELCADVAQREALVEAAIRKAWKDKSPFKAKFATQQQELRAYLDEVYEQLKPQYTARYAN